MQSPSRMIAVALAVLLLAAAMTMRGGFYTPGAVVLAIGALAFAAGACLTSDRLPSYRSIRAWLPPILAVGLSGVAISNTDLAFPNPIPSYVAALPWIAGIGFGLTVTIVVHLTPWAVHLRRWLPAQVLLLFLSGFLLRATAVLASPNPPIDVYTALRGAADYVMLGENPYAPLPYEHPYPFPPYSYDRYPFYPPLPFLLMLPFRAVGLDIRFANVVCDLLAAFVLYRVAQFRGDALTGAWFAAAFLHFPNAPFMMEQTWFEPMLAVLLASGLLLVERGRRIGFLLLGLALTGKQYGVILLLPLLRALRQHWWKLILGVAAAGALVLLPFLFLGPHDFLDTIFFKWLDRPLREDSLTVSALLHDLQQRPRAPSISWIVDRRAPSISWIVDRLVLSRSVCWIIAGVLIAGVAWRTPARATAAAPCLATCLFAFCLFHSQGFFNYYYLCEYLFLLGLCSSIAEPARPKAV